MYDIKSEDVYEDFSSNKEKFDFRNYSTNSKNYNNSNKLVIGKMKDEIGGVQIEKCGEHKKDEHNKAIGVNENVVATIRHKRSIYWIINI